MKKKQSPAQPVVPARKPVVTIIITEDNGNVEVKGPVGDKILMYGLLDLAKDAVRTGTLIQ